MICFFELGNAWIDHRHVNPSQPHVVALPSLLPESLEGEAMVDHL